MVGAFSQSESTIALSLSPYHSTMTVAWQNPRRNADELAAEQWLEMSTSGKCSSAYRPFEASRYVFHSSVAEGLKNTDVV